MSLLRSCSLSDQPIWCSFLACLLAAAGALHNEARGQDAGTSTPATGENILQNLNYEPATDDQDTSYGEAPEDNSLVFLRRVSPLLKPGDYQVDVGLAYTLYHADLPFLVDQTPDPDSVYDARIVARSMTVPFCGPLWPEQGPAVVHKRSPELEQHRSSVCRNRYLRKYYGNWWRDLGRHLSAEQPVCE